MALVNVQALGIYMAKNDSQANRGIIFFVITLFRHYPFSVIPAQAGNQTRHHIFRHSRAGGNPDKAGGGI